VKPSQLAINSVSTRHADLEEALDAYAAAGFTNVEFVLPQVKQYLTQGKTRDDLRRLLDRHKMRCVGGFECVLQCFSAAADRAENHQLIVENAKLLAELGAATMVVGTDGPGDGQKIADPIGEMAQTFGSVAKQIQGTGVTLCIEFNWSPIVKSLRTAAEIARRAGLSNVGVLFDPAHYHCTPSKFEQLTAENVALIKHIHVDDMADKPGELSHCNRDRVLPNQGCLDLVALFGQIERHGYRGHFSIEMFSAELWGLPAHTAAKRMYESLLPLCEMSAETMKGIK
jgi:4-hydroxyphenylpyruvate dioxygenase